MSIFSKLLALHRGKGIELADEDAKTRTPEEDFFTEIVAHLIRTQPDLALDWFNRDLFPQPRKYGPIAAITQQRFPTPVGFDKSSRVDLVVTLHRDESADVLFIESKIRSHEGWNQLRKYAVTLNEQKVTGERWLVYVTRDFEPKPPSGIDPSGVVQFKQLRWHRFYRALKSRPSNQLTQEIIAFMEETQMSQGNRFTASDIVAMQHLGRTTGLMDATLADEIEERFERLVGSPQWNPVYDDLSRMGRYMLYRGMPARWWCGLGFFPANEPEDYPQLGLTLEVDPKTKERPSIVTAMKEWCVENSAWYGYNLDMPHQWSGIRRRLSLGAFLDKEDHVAEVRRYFGECLSDLERFKLATPKLPWG